jgi:hypothetical protein
MTTIYFEDGISATVIATFTDNDAYAACAKALETWATINGGYITESEA